MPTGAPPWHCLDRAALHPLLGLIRSMSDDSFASGHEMAELVTALRDCRGFDHELSLVAVRDGEVIGYALFSNVGIRGRPGRCGTALTPLCVASESRESGVDSSLVDAGITACRTLGKDFVVSPHAGVIFRQFHFVPAEDMEVQTRFPPGSSMVLELVPGILAGENAHIEHPSRWCKILRN